jgi:hypothetical protein
VLYLRVAHEAAVVAGVLGLQTKLTFLSIKLTFLSVKLTFLSIKLTFLSIKRRLSQYQTPPFS